MPTKHCQRKMTTFSNGCFFIDMLCLEAFVTLKRNSIIAIVSDQTPEQALLVQRGLKEQLRPHIHLPLGPQ
ncbi:hypothetical protein J5TS2_37720 [Brevibacillus halotolerans]|nr:hypothetical protein J5TS2_37720 [Brevibacillus halotolerans]